MKKTLITLLITIFSFSLFAQEPELSDYEKYHMQKEAEMLGETTAPDTIHDTVYVVVENTEPVVINNYNMRQTQPNLRFNLSFGYGWGYYNQPYYSYYDPFYYGYGYGYPSYGGWYGGYYNYEAYYGMYYPYYGYNHYYGHNHWYGHNYGYYSQPRGRRYATSNALGWNKSYYKPYNKTYRSGNVNTATRVSTVAKSTQVRRPVTTTRATQYTKNGTAVKTNSRTNGERKYSPTYKQPRTVTKSTYNRSNQQRSTTVRTPASTQRSTSYNRPASTKSRSTSYSRPASTQSRSSYQRSSAPSRSSSSYRSSGSSGSRSYSSGGSSRSSGSATRSSGGSRSSGGKK